MQDMFTKNRNLIFILILTPIIGALLYFNLRTIASKFISGSTNIGETMVLGWGINTKGQLGASNKIEDDYFLVDSSQLGNVTQVASGLLHSIALNSEGEVWSWGSNNYGQLGDGTMVESRNAPVKVKLNVPIVKIAANQHHNLAIDEDGNVWAWGLNMSGQIGDGTRENRNTPVQVKTVKNAKEIAVGYRFSLATTNEGKVWAWGGNCEPSNDPKFKDFLSNLSQGLTVAGSYYDPVDSTIDGEDESNNCINEEFVNIRSITPILIPELDNITQISAGFGHMMALEESGYVWVWGCNTYGQAGHGYIGNTIDNSKPRKIEALQNIVAVSAGYRHSMALDQNGQVWGWGHNYHGEVGDDTAKDQTAPQLLTLPKIKSVYAGHDYTLAITEDKKIYGWGQNLYQQLAGYEGPRYKSPQYIRPLDDLSMLSTGGGHVIGIKPTIM